MPVRSGGADVAISPALQSPPSTPLPLLNSIRLREQTDGVLQRTAYSVLHAIQSLLLDMYIITCSRAAAASAANAEPALAQSIALQALGQRCKPVELPCVIPRSESESRSCPYPTQPSTPQTSSPRTPSKHPSILRRALLSLTARQSTRCMLFPKPA